MRAPIGQTYSGLQQKGPVQVVEGCLQVREMLDTYQFPGDDT